MAKQSRTCVFTINTVMLGFFLWNCNFFCTRGALVRRVWWPRRCQYPQECFGLEQEKAQIWFMGWSCSTQSGFPLEKHFYQANIIWSGIYFIKHIYNTLDKFKTMYENRNKIHKRWKIIAYVHFYYSTLRKTGFTALKTQELNICWIMQFLSQSTLDSSLRSMEIDLGSLGDFRGCISGHSWKIWAFFKPDLHQQWKRDKTHSNPAWCWMEVDTYHDHNLPK